MTGTGEKRREETGTGEKRREETGTGEKRRDERNSVEFGFEPFLTKKVRFKASNYSYQLLLACRNLP